MPGRAAPLAAVLVFLVFLCGASGARAADPSEPVRIVYDAPAGCPDVAAFKTELRGRSKQVREADGSERGPVRTLDVAIRPSTEGLTGTLDVVERGGARSRRSVSGTSCDSVARALALMAALAIDSQGESAGVLSARRPIDPLAITSPAGASDSPGAPLPEGGPTVAPQTTDLAQPAVTRDASPPSPAPPPASRPVATPGSRDLASAFPPPAAREAPVRIFVGGGADVSWGITPDVVVAPRLFLQVESTSRGLWSPSVRAAFERAVVDGAPAPGAAARFAWTVGTFDGCPIRWGFATAALLPCVRIEAGELEATGEAIVPSRDATRGWLALAALAQARWEFFPHVAIEADAGVRAPLVRDRFVFEPDVTVYKPPAFAAFVGGGLEVAFF